MAYLAIVTVLALLEYLAFGFLVGRARAKYGIKAPATSGDPIFDRYFRVHQNTGEQLLLFLPALWVFGSFVSYAFGAIVGLVFIAGRVVYLRGYVADPEKRGTGFLIGGLIGALLAAFRG